MKWLLFIEDSRKTRGGQATRGAKHWLQHIVARATSFALLGFMIPAALFGQKTNDLIIALQRDMSSLQEQMKTLQKSQDEKMAAIQAMLQQAVDGSARVSSSITNLQREVDTKLNDQQGKLVAPVATLGTKVDQMSDEFRAVSTTVADLAHRMNALDGKLKDISDLIRILGTQAPAAPAPTVQVPASPCAGASAENLWDSARRDESGGKPEIAIEQYANYVKCYSDTARAPEAQYKIGWIYFNNSQYDEAVKPFDEVLERFPENPKTQEALYYKAVSLVKGGHPTDAGKVFKEYLARYPRGEHVAAAHTNLKNLGLEPRTPTSRKH